MEQGQYKADKVNGTDIVAKGEQILRLSLGDQFVTVQILNGFSTHGKAAEKSHDHSVADILGHPEEWFYDGINKYSKSFGQSHANHHS